MFEKVIYMAFHFITSYICTVMLSGRLLNDNKYFKIKKFAVVICTVPFLMMTENMLMVYRTIFAILIYSTAVWIIYNKGFLISMIISVFSYSIVLLCDVLNSSIYMKLFDIDMAYIKNHYYLICLMCFTFFDIALFITIFIKPVKYFSYMEDATLKKDFTSVLGYTVLFILFTSILAYIISVQPYLSLQHMLSALALVLLVIMNIIYFYQIKISSKNKYEYENIKYYSENIERTADILASRDHEYKNRLIGISALVENKQYDDAQLFIQNIMNISDCDYSNAMATYNNIKDVVLRNILILKTGTAISKGIKVNANIRNTITDIDISKVELNDVTSIIMDNAIEGAAGSNEKAVEIMAGKDGDEVSIIIANTYPKEYAEVALFKEGCSAKGKGRGNGLYLLSRIEENNSRINIDTTVTKDMFIQEITIKINTTSSTTYKQ